jgi:hypothetical protein
MYDTYHTYSSRVKQDHRHTHFLSSHPQSKWANTNGLLRNYVPSKSRNILTQLIFIHGSVLGLWYTRLLPAEFRFLPVEPIGTSTSVCAPLEPTRFFVPCISWSSLFSQSLFIFIISIFVFLCLLFMIYGSLGFCRISLGEGIR